MPPAGEISLCAVCDSVFKQSDLLSCPSRSVGLLEILRTNSGHRDATALRALISSLPAELARYDKEIGRLDVLFETLTADRSALQKFYDQCIGVLDAPIRRLPKEVIIEIFSFCNESTVTSHDPIPPSMWAHEAQKELRRVAGGPLVALSQVSTHWREVALGTPLLWSRITLDLRCWELPATSFAHQQMIRLLDLALARSQQTPLAIEVSGIGQCHPVALQHLALVSSRWRSANFVVECDMLRHLSKVAGNLPLLETLRINALTENMETLLEVGKFFSQAPRLRTVDFCGPLVAVGDLPLEQLGCCTYSGLGPEDLVPLLLHMRRLVNSELHIQLNCRTISSALPLHLPPVVSPIEQLNICSVDHGGIESMAVLGELFAALTLPAMERLHLYGASDSGHPLYWPHAEGSALLLRSGSQTALQSLVLHDVVIAECDLLECLGQLPTLKYLFISDHTAVVNTPAHHLITDTLLQRLTPQPATSLVPHLAVADFKTLGRFSDDVLVAFAVQRSLLASAESVFECALLWIPGSTREASPRTCEVLSSLVASGRLMFTGRMYDPEIDS
ncbi:hypothetical protein C8F04DRAFT_1295906 [Mycena alexandri]|uniref:F-box domain-containing protein n=1 Tax=Mycena alexandri TaxID=1745969 RepID=A0AAD6SF89_9AGAR|nr:hypothetical protein C8F04DRAFT_1295906 [Mycena alexandri]